MRSHPGARGGDLVPMREAVKAWFSISVQTFGGPAGQIAVMHRELVDGRRWIGQRRFLHALGFCTLLPGPEAQQLAIYLGWLLNGVRGGLVAGTLFVLPGMLALLALSVLYVAAGESVLVQALFLGLAPAVLAIVVQAVLRVAGRALGHWSMVVVAIGTFVALAVLAVPFPLVIAVAAIVGWALGRWAPRTVDRPLHSAVEVNATAPLLADESLHTQRPSTGHAVRVLVLGLLAWGAPMVAVVAFTGTGSVFTQQGVFFTGTALVTFGGAYAVLAYVAQQAVDVYDWLEPGEMVDGLALAETTPGPLIMVVQFVAFLGAYRSPGDLNPWVAAVIGALLTTWVTFVPCFVFIFLGAPYVERLRGNRSLAAALAGITAAVVGVIANLAVYFALHTVFERTLTWSAGPVRVELPALDTARPVSVVIAIVAAVLMLRLRWSVPRTLGACAALGLGAGLAGLPGS